MKKEQMDEFIMLQKQLIRQNWKIYNLHLWGLYGKELKQIKETKSAKFKNSDRYEQACIFMIKQILDAKEIGDSLLPEEKENLVKEAKFWVNRPMMKKIWKLYKFWFPSWEKGFIDGLIEE